MVVFIREQRKSFVMKEQISLMHKIKKAVAKQATDIKHCRY